MVFRPYRWLLMLWTPAVASADTLPWVDPGDVPLPSGVASVQIQRQDEALFAGPSHKAARRGSAAEGAHLPIYAATRGPGCQNRWLMVGPLAWVCEDAVKLSPTEPLAPRAMPPTLPDGLPHRYHFVGPNGSLGYVSLATAEEGVPDAELQPGFAVALTHVARKSGGDPFGLTTHRLWLPMRDLNPARPFTFRGEELDGSLSIGWVHADTAHEYTAPNGRRLDTVHARFTALRVLDTATKAGREWYRIGDGRWVHSRDVRVATSAPLPASLRTGERWLDVDVERQVLVAYEGERPVFATLVSTGKGRGKNVQATPKGEHRIWVKLVSSDMDNLENEEASRYYAIQDVPWVMYFKKGYGLHGTFWHRSFGNVRSHGCVNLTPLDAQRLFAWTSPRVPAGWTAALPTEFEPGTLVRVR